MKLRVLASFTALLLLAGQSNAAIVLQVSENPAPDPDLQSFTVRAVAGGSGEVVNSVAGLNIDSGVHHVTPAFGQPSTTRAQWDAPNGAGDPAWKIFDTYLLFNATNASEVVGFIGSATETNDGTDPAGLALSFSGAQAVEGLGGYRFGSATDQISLTPASSSSSLPFLQVVIPGGTTVLLDGTFFNAQGEPFTIVDFPISGVVIPEPATLLMAGIGLVGIVAAARRRK